MTSPTGLVFDIRKYSVHDGPGIRTTVFLKGCPLRCTWCHNPESQSARPEVLYRASRCLACRACLAACPNEALTWQSSSPQTDLQRCTLCGACTRACPTQAREMAGEERSLDEIVALIERDVAFYDESGGGVTLSGGEPLMQPVFVGALLRACREREIHTVLDTCGYAPWQTLDALRGNVDLFLYDLKVMDARLHRQVTGVSNRIILSNLEQLARLGHAIRIRVPLIPGITDTIENMRAIGAFVQRLPGVRQVDLLPFHALAAEKYQRLGLVYSLPQATPQPQQALQSLASVLSNYDLSVTFGG